MVTSEMSAQVAALISSAGLQVHGYMVNGRDSEQYINIASMRYKSFFQWQNSTDAVKQSLVVHIGVLVAIREQ